MLNQSPGKQRGKKNTVFKQALLVIVILIASASCSYETPGDLKTGSAKSAAIVGKIGLLEQELADSVKNGDDVKIGRILDKDNNNQKGLFKNSTFFATGLARRLI